LVLMMDESAADIDIRHWVALAWAQSRGRLLERNKSITLLTRTIRDDAVLLLEYKHAANVHLDEVEHRDTIVFLQPREGPRRGGTACQVPDRLDG